MVIFIDFHGIEGSVVLGLIFYGFHRSFQDFKRICVDFIDSWGIWCPWLDFLWLSSILNDFKWICVDFMDSWGPRSGALWRPVATHGAGLDGSRGPKETLQSWNLHSDD